VPADVAGTAIDAAQFAQLAETMGDELAALIEDFVGTTNLMFGSLGEPAVRADVNVVTRHAHTLKGNAALIGAGRLCELARALEAGCTHGVPPHLDQELAPLRAEFARVCADLKGPMRLNRETSDV
jgi:HPt (histidine-containing phosphotransfer) domain-containing protein